MSTKLFPGAEVEPLTPERVLAGLRTGRFGQNIVYRPRLGSTNDLARAQAVAGTPEGLLVLAEEQTAGRGRQGRAWHAPFGGALLASLLLRPTFLPPPQAFLLTALAAMAVADTVVQETGLAAEIKWPNDVLLDGRKLCGILVELQGRPGAPAGAGEPASPGTLEWAVLGWGLNVNVDFGPDLAGWATSLAGALGRPIPRLPLLWGCLERMETAYEGLRAGTGDEIWAAWRARLSTIGRAVEVRAPDETFSGTALDVARNGALLVRREDATVVPILAADVSVGHS